MEKLSKYLYIFSFSILFIVYYLIERNYFKSFNNILSFCIEKEKLFWIFYLFLQPLIIILLNKLIRNKVFLFLTILNFLFLIMLLF